jgi:LmbE family N-acetylglucosaminyl deacetylase
VREALSSIAFADERLLIVAPHPDDDVIGCGGTIARASSERGAVNVMYVTDGSASHVGSLAYPPARLREVREGEARAALQILGVPATQIHFMRESDGLLTRYGTAARDLATRIAIRIAAVAPTIVFSPWLRDGHSDHVAVSLAVRRALATSSAALYEYTVWLADFGTPEDAPRPDEAEPFGVDVRAYRNLKARALRAHRSQFGGLITDAAHAFALPDTLLARAAVDVERFHRITARAVPAA